LVNVIDNADFEKPVAADAAVPDWSVTMKDGVTVQIDRAYAHGGKQSARITSKGPVACLVSRPFAPPATGRIAMSLWLRVADAQHQPPLRLALEGKLNGRDYYRFAPVGLLPDGASTGVTLSNEWAQYVFQVDDLPLEGLASLRARIDLMGRGEVWIDDVQMYHLAFSRPEIVELSKLITLADVKLQNGQVSDCLHLLEGYWPRFLVENVPLPPGIDPASKTPGNVAEQPAAKRPPTEEKNPPAADRTGFFEKMKSLWPDSLRF
jgi:hypothetical protein